MQAMGFSRFRNFWSDVYDFTPSPDNWSFLPKASFANLLQIPRACHACWRHVSQAGAVSQDVTGTELLMPISDDVKKHLASDLAEVSLHCIYLDVPDNLESTSLVCLVYLYTSIQTAGGLQAVPQTHGQRPLMEKDKGCLFMLFQDTASKTALEFAHTAANQVRITLYARAVANLIAIEVLTGISCLGAVTSLLPSASAGAYDD